MAGKITTVGELLNELNYLDVNTPVVSENGKPIFVGLKADLKRGNKLVIYGELNNIKTQVIHKYKPESWEK